ncbi:DUF968 domain-containing protein [Oceanisphaera sediminis]|uniref:DUF968 domain-containing protein n=1 Tax=Oceanisphaera sediminis TaxID=981381 RepID=A0ABP7DGX5_9GAMM
MSKALIANPVFSDELGLLMFRAEAATLQAFRLLLDKQPVLLAPVPDELAVVAPGLVEHQGEASRLPGQLVLAFMLQDKVYQALGGASAFTQWQGRADRCVIHGDDCIGGFTWSSGRYPVSLCWHHDNAHRAEPLPNVEAVVVRRLAAFGMSRVAEFVGRARGGEVSAAELAWWASAHGVHALLPESLALTALGRKATITDRHTAHGWKDTDARYDARDHIADLSKMVKPIKFEVDAEPPASFMARPKLTRWQSEAYLKFVRSQPCVVTGSTEAVEAHHMIGNGHSGMAMKTHDLMTFPLCHDEHMKLHDGGWQRWEQAHGSQLAHVMATLNKAAGLGVFG